MKMSDTPRICKHVHIVMGGRNDQHVEVGVSEIECHSLHVITTEDFEDQYDSKIKRICEDAEVERGLLIAIPTQDIFSEEAATSVREAMHRICEKEGYSFPLLEGHNKEISSQSGTQCRFMVNITGGTNLMAGAAVHVSSMIGATPYYVSKKEDGSGSRVVTFPSMTIMSLLSRFDHTPMSELLNKPTGNVDDLSQGTALILELASLGYASIQGEKLHYELSEDVKSILWQTIQARQPSDISQGKDKFKQFKDQLDSIGKERKKDGEEYVTTLITLGHDSCKNAAYRLFMENNDLEIRAEIWEGPKGYRVRIYYATSGEDHGGESFDGPNHGPFSERWSDRKEAITFLLSGADFPRIAEGKEGEAIASAISSDNDMVILSFVARKKVQWAYFDVPGGYGPPSSV